MTLARIKRIEEKYLLQTYDRYQLALSRGSGVYCYGEDGTKYLDFLSGIGVMALGYSHPAVTRVIREQSARLVHCSNLFYTPFQGRLAQRLTRLSGLDRAFFSNSGAEAWEGALKIARAYAGKTHKGKRVRFLALENSFHGRTMGAVATTFTEKYRKPFAPVMPGVSFVKFNDVADLRRQFGSDVCAVCAETVQGESGIYPVSQEFLFEARKLTRGAGALLLIDEIQCGLGRTGKMFAYQHYGLQPDIVTLAKPLAAGLPLGAILVREKVAAAIKPGMHGTTFGGGPLACAVALEVLDVLEREGLVKKATEMGAYFESRLRRLKAEHPAVTDVRGLGLMLAIELDSADLAKAVHQRLLSRKIIVNRTHDTTLRFLPPYIVTKRHIDQVADELGAALKAAAAKSPRKGASLARA
jgi:acetylornithine aminotransferase/acetylornithine/N-succinyldiaminopimelate aminotransferase